MLPNALLETSGNSFHGNLWARLFGVPSLIRPTDMDTWCRIAHFDVAVSDPFPILLRFSLYRERVFDRKAASSTIGAHICLFLRHVEHL